ncbi:hypothetical protein CBM2609_A120253 [Cupriavidus taiwanensis]|nr:hypothetical protein CBM2604_A100250 [Cupriavidus taiwanensis]SOZ23961.1 hypothetical protein CBM2609_A120253 [Cupriavidus taiwanensis]
MHAPWLAGCSRALQSQSIMALSHAGRNPGFRRAGFRQLPRGGRMRSTGLTSTPLAPPHVGLPPPMVL